MSSKHHTGFGAPLAIPYSPLDNGPGAGNLSPIAADPGSRGAQLGSETQIKRVFPSVRPSAAIIAGLGGTVGGSSVAALLAMARAAPGDRVAEQGYTLTLDPEYTAPGAAVAVHFGDASAATILRPGDTLEVPGGFRDFWCWNAHGWVLDTFLSFSPAVTPGGACAFLVGKAPGAMPWYRRNVTARGAAALLNAALVVAIGVPTFGTNKSLAGLVPIVSSGLAGVRVAVIPWANGTSKLVAAPADYAVTIRTWVLTQAAGDAAQVYKARPLGTADAPDACGVWCPLSGGDMVASQNVQVFDRAIPAGALALAFGATTAQPYGTAIGGAYLTVEGY